MNNPELYKKISDVVEDGSQSIMNKYANFFQVNGLENKKILDIGCGPGNFTYNSIYLPFKANIDTIIGIDQSEEMVNHANKHYKNDQITFKHLNIEDSFIAKELSDQFHCIFSFWTLHFVKDYTLAFKNILEMMKVGGDALLVFPFSGTLFSVYPQIWKRPQWKPFIKDGDILELPYINHHQPQEEFKAFLNSLGFKTLVCEIKSVALLYPPNMAKEFISSIIPVFENIPKMLRDDFLEDHLKEFTNIKKKEALNGFDYKLFVVHVKK